MPESRITSCGSIMARGRSYSVKMTRVARPVGRGKNFSGYYALIDAGEVLRRCFQVGAPRQVAFDVTDQPLRMKRGAAGVIAGHALENLQKFGSIMERAHNALQAVATVAAKQYSFLPVRARQIGEPFPIGGLRCDILGGT